MSEQKPDISSLNKAILDLQAIKATLENKERLFPGPVWNFYLIGGCIILSSILNGLITELHGKLVESILFIWTPIIAICLIVVALSIWSHVRTGRGVWSLSMKNFQISRIVMTPPVLTIGVILYNYGYELGTIALFVAASNIAIFTLTLPRITLIIPVILTIIGWIQMSISSPGPLLGVVDGCLIGLSIMLIGLIVYIHRRHEHE